DFGDAVLLPPMVNVHTHLELTEFQVWAQECGIPQISGTFVDWILHLVKIRRMIDPARFSASLSAGLQASLAAGVGAVGDILTTLETASAYQPSPLRGRVFCEVLGRDSEQVTARLKSIEALTSASCAAGLSWGISPHAPYTLAEATAAQIAEFAVRKDLPIAIHLAETEEEVTFLEKAQGPIAEHLYTSAGWQVTASSHDGLRPVAWAERCACLPLGSLVVHGVHVNEDDVNCLANRNCSVALCPRSNSAFGAARAPLALYRAAGVNLALGTDSMASAPSLSIWDELAFARSWFQGELSPAEWLEMATLDGAIALGIGQSFGSLAPAKEASFQVTSVPAGASLASLEEALCEQGEQAAVHELFIAGKPTLSKSVKNNESGLLS
ncbi:MAG: amidohydrolase family protein, partial [Desulfuromonadales bacterium]|nr:amidohydrolase family protein [Desulfuromonadales bacterium]